ncbi:Co/Zn/Cd efflux system component [Aquamicrobium lusatiense]|uniref:Co/Zn/Cd efflux system component n=1 Tax=Aquamicrobium lusatiense TaxID=89772 RepID=A0A7W9S6E0_9HYPH|nr:hypothetical protein [Aquamicrobium lusatiense]MBB6014619.1 Co/Zn/Cd efflux system component [Aquamicrobium lusatiense]
MSNRFIEQQKPFGHQRLELLTGILVAALLAVVQQVVRFSYAPRPRI